MVIVCLTNTLVKMLYAVNITIVSVNPQKLHDPSSSNLDRKHHDYIPIEGR